MKPAVASTNLDIIPVQVDAMNARQGFTINLQKDKVHNVSVAAGRMVRQCMTEVRLSLVAIKGHTSGGWSTCVHGMAMYVTTTQTAVPTSALCMWGHAKALRSRDATDGHRRYAQLAEREKEKHDYLHGLILVFSLRSLVSMF